MRVLANDLDVYAAVLQGMKSYKHGNLITIIEHNEVKVNKTFYKYIYPSCSRIYFPLEQTVLR